MASNRDTLLGSQAIHLAAVTGNKFLIETLIKEYQANYKENTLGKQNVIHLAA